jgi:hypothetical protein
MAIAVTNSKKLLAPINARGYLPEHHARDHQSAT